tara:strand:+ start:206416 stop:206811 length:396 start_codon:yes stop_codon:yes gene_type:complete
MEKDLLVERIKILETQIDETNAEIKARDKVWDNSKSWFDYENHMDDLWEKNAELGRQFRVIQPYEMNEAPSGDVMTLKEFIENVECGGFIDYDGSGYYTKDNLESNITIYPSDITNGMYRNDFTHVSWYNR